MSLFTKATDIKTTDRLLVSLWGLPKAGKTTAVVGNPGAGIAAFPTPIYLLNFDQGFAELLPNLDPGVKEQIYNVDLVADDPFLTAAKAALLVRKAEDSIAEAIQGIREAGNGTIVIDTMSHYWQLVQRVMLDEIKAKREVKEQKLFPFDYADANTRFRTLVLKLKSSGANVVLLHHARPVYDQNGNQVSGLYVPQDNSQTEALVQVQAQVWVQETANGPIHGATVQFCRMNDAIRNQEVYGVFDYPTLYELIYGLRPEGY